MVQQEGRLSQLLHGKARWYVPESDDPEGEGAEQAPVEPGKFQGRRWNPAAKEGSEASRSLDSAARRNQ